MGHLPGSRCLVVSLHKCAWVWAPPWPWPCCSLATKSSGGRGGRTLVTAPTLGEGVPGGRAAPRGAAPEQAAVTPAGFFGGVTVLSSCRGAEQTPVNNLRSHPGSGELLGRPPLMGFTLHRCRAGPEAAPPVPSRCVRCVRKTSCAALQRCGREGSRSPGRDAGGRTGRARVKPGRNFPWGWERSSSEPRSFSGVPVAWTRWGFTLRR